MLRLFLPIPCKATWVGWKTVYLAWQGEGHCLSWTLDTHTHTYTDTDKHSPTHHPPYPGSNATSNAYLPSDVDIGSAGGAVERLQRSQIRCTHWNSFPCCSSVFYCAMVCWYLSIPVLSFCVTHFDVFSSLPSLTCLPNVMLCNVCTVGKVCHLGCGQKTCNWQIKAISSHLISSSCQPLV